jgi:uncharacterized protein YciI
MKHWLLTYTLAPDYLERRTALRAEHLALAQGATERGELLLGGAIYEAGAPPAEALLLFAGDDASAAEEFARSDPYVAQGLVTRWSVREWTTVAGQWSAPAVS